MNEKTKRKIKTILKFGPETFWDSRYFILCRRKNGKKYLEKVKNRYENGKYLNDVQWFFYYITGYEINLENPKTFSEKVVWSSLFNKDPLRTILCDKYLAKEWINKRLGGEYAVPLLGVWDKFDDIDFDALPDEFVLKVNSGCRWQMIVRDKKKFDKNKAKPLYDEWMAMKYTFCGLYETQYLNVPPKIIAEQCLPPFLEGSNEYKFLCFDGKVDSIYVFNKPVINGKTVYTTTMYSRDWERLDWVDDRDWPVDPVTREKPEKLDEMVKIAEKLSEGINFVRVDLYEVSGKIYVGELTFTPSSGLFRFSTYEDDLRLGNRFIIKR